MAAALETATPQLSPRRNAVAHAWLTSPEYHQLVTEAARRGEHPDQLAGAIVRAVLVNGYVDAVLNAG